MNPTHDYVVVGAGLFGSVFARCAAECGKRVLVVERRSHLGGNCYSEDVGGIQVHRYGPHIFHTNNLKVWQLVNRFATFNHYRHRGTVRHGNRLFSFPINLLTLHQLWGVGTPAEARRRLEEARVPCENPRNLEEWILAQVGHELYETFVRGYTTKQWGRDPSQLPSSIIRRIPIRLTWDDSYFDDTYQGIPVGGYTQMFENMLDHPGICMETGVDFFANQRELVAAGDKLVFSGKIDEYFQYRFGELEYRSLRFETKKMPGDFQGAAIVNYAAAEVPYTRIVEHQHFAFQQHDETQITYEYPQQYAQGREAFYPIRDDRNSQVYEQYRHLVEQTGAIFGGRLGTYQYFDMHQVVAQAMAVAEREIGAPPISICTAA